MTFLPFAAIAWAVVKDPTKKAVPAGKRHLPSALVSVVEGTVESAPAENAVTAGKQHLEVPKAAEPDGEKNDPAAKNFVSWTFKLVVTVTLRPS